MALGASAGYVQTRILIQTLTLAAAGIGAGTIGSWILARTISGLLYGVSPSDPLTFGAMLFVIVAIAAVAGYPRAASGTC